MICPHYRRFLAFRQVAQQLLDELKMICSANHAVSQVSEATLAHPQAGSLEQVTPLGLELGSLGVDDDGVDLIVLLLTVKADLVGTRFIDLSTNRITEKGVTLLAAAAANGAMPQLEALNLRMNEIGNGGVKALTDACAHEASGAVHRSRQGSSLGFLDQSATSSRSEIFGALEELLLNADSPRFLFACFTTVPSLSCYLLLIMHMPRPGSDCPSCAH